MGILCVHLICVSVLCTCTCVCRWSSSSVLHVANMCRDIPMSQEEMQFLIEKILRYTMIPLTLILTILILIL